MNKMFRHIEVIDLPVNDRLTRVLNPLIKIKRTKSEEIKDELRRIARSKIRKYQQRYQQNHKSKIATLVRKYQTTKINQCPEWVDHKEIEKYYALAQRKSLETGIKHHVDHIHPLNGRNSRGLHVPWNLQVVEASINLSKSNKII